MNVTIENVRIAAISCFLPEKNLEMTALNELFGEQEVSKIMEITGIQRVRVSDPEMTSSDMCFLAANDLLARTGVDKAGIGGLVFVSQTPDYILPSTAVRLQDRLGLSQETACFDVPYGCSGFIYGLLIASMLIGSSACEHVLVLAGDTSTKMLGQRDKSVRMVFGDAGSAALVSRGSGRMSFAINSDGSRFHQLIVPAGMFRNPATEETKKVTERESQNWRSEEDLYMDGMAIFDFAIHEVHENIDKLVASMNWNKTDVGVFALHQANAYMVNYIRKKLKVDREKTPVSVQNYGNTGPASIPLVLCDTFAGKTDLTSLGKSVLCGFGVGLSWGSVACDLSETTFFAPINK